MIGSFIHLKEVWVLDLFELANAEDAKRTKKPLCIAVISALYDVHDVDTQCSVGMTILATDGRYILYGATEQYVR